MTDQLLLWPPAGSHHWRIAEALLKTTRWDEWTSWNWKQQSREIDALAAALSRIIPTSDLGEYVESAAAAQVRAALDAALDEACPRCGHRPASHRYYECCQGTLAQPLCACPLTPSDVNALLYSDPEEDRRD